MTNLLSTSSDEIERLHARIKELETQVNHWRNLIETTNVLVIDLAADGSILYLNPAAERVFQIARNDWEGRSLSEFLAVEDLDQVRQSFFAAIQSRSPSLMFQCRVQSPRGGVFHGLWTVALHYDADGNYVGASATAYDVSPIEQARREAEASRAMLQLVIDSLPQAIFWKDRDSRYLGANRRLLEDAGLNRLADIIGKSDTDMPWVEQAPLYRADDLAVMANGPKLNIEEPLTRADGTQIWLRTNKLPLVRDGEVIGVLAMYEDVTEERRKADELRTFKAIIDNAPDGIIVADTNQVITYANAAMTTMLGYPSLVGLLASAIVPPQTLTLQRMPELMQIALTGGKANVQVDYLRRDGTILTVNAAGLAIFNDSGQLIGFATINRDISEQLRLEEERRRMQEQVIEAQQAMLRELSTPLLPIADQVVAMPIIGTIDTNRASQIMETLLEGVARYRARIAILDITGVRVVDTQVAGALIRAAQAARLLGAQVIITGIGPEVAQTLVHIGAELTNMVAKPNLQEGIAFALRQRNGDRVPVGI
ncbi:PAS domain S-box protein [Chloroflexus sp.]|uniref:PAS domain S-box protein n=1 Tax=Chloroflexus sp. TaxID=1904827 RepID=UPI00298F326F|nr:PAS domain S-box protein [Chloroflexus sp.]MDW8405440.1 PAS domain S-box protein [Chloroflexus sp.]